MERINRVKWLEKELKEARRDPCDNALPSLNRYISGCSVYEFSDAGMVT